MGLYPDVQKKARAEIDAVVGQDRLPTYADVASMPYLQAMYLEVLRWNQVVPLGASSIKFHRLDDQMLNICCRRPTRSIGRRLL